MTTRRATVEDTLSKLCEDGKLSGAEKATMLRLWALGLKSAIWDGCFVPLRVWRAFYRRHPDALLESCNLVLRARGQQFKAEDDAEAAMAAIDGLLAFRQKMLSPIFIGPFTPDEVHQIFAGDAPMEVWRRLDITDSSWLRADALRGEREDIWRIVLQLDAEYAAAAAMSSIDAVLSSRNVPEAVPGSGAGR